MAKKFTRGCTCCGGGGGTIPATCTGATICVTVNGCPSPAAPIDCSSGIGLIDPNGVVHASIGGRTEPCKVCISANVNGTYTINTAATGYFSRSDSYVHTCTNGTEVDIGVGLTPTMVSICVTGCHNPDGLSGATCTFSGAITGSGTTDGTGCCTVAISNPLNPGDTWTLTISKPSRWADYTTTQTVAGSGNPLVIGGSMPCSFQVQMIPAECYVCCPSDCDPHCQTATLTTPFGSCSGVTPIGAGVYTCSFTKVVSGWDLVGAGPVYGSTCQTSGATPVPVTVTFTVTMDPCTGNVTINYLTCISSGCGSVAMRDTPAGGSYIPGIFASASCTGTGSPICPPDETTAVATIIGSLYCDGTYTLSEDCEDCIAAVHGGGGPMLKRVAASSMAIAPEAVEQKAEIPSLASMIPVYLEESAAHKADGGRLASPEVQAERKAICMGCVNMEKDGAACRACGCGIIGALSFIGLDMDEKRAWASSRCPLKAPKWAAV